MIKNGLVGQILITYMKNGKEGWGWFDTEEDVSNFLRKQTEGFTILNAIRIKAYDEVNILKLSNFEK